MIIILGPPGSGKGTQTRLVAAKTNRPYFSAGDTLKIYANNHPEIKETIRQGGLIEQDEVSHYLMITGLNLGQNVIFDGFPRTVKQCHYLCKTMSTNQIEKIFILDVSEEEVERRLIARYICNSCHKTYSFLSFCCNIENIRRADDLFQESIKKRYNGFTSNIKPILEIFKSNNIPTHYIHGQRQIEEITSDIIEMINKE